MDLKKIAGLAFIIAFLMALVLFTGTGRNYISISTAKIIFIISGAIGLFLNLLSYKTGKHNAIFNFIYWAGSIVLFTGLIFQLMRWPFSFYIIIVGFVILGLSFLLPENLTSSNEESDLLDN